MRGFSKAIIAGNVTRDPELKTTPSGSSVCNFAIAVNRAYRDSAGSMQEAVSYLECAAWGKQGETINQYVKKGSPLLVSGRLEQHNWTDKTSGQKRSRIEIFVEDFSFLGNRSDRDGGSMGGRDDAVMDVPAPADEQVPDDMANEAINLDEIPF